MGTSVADFRAGLARLGSVCGAITCDRPFLGPLYTWVEACAGGTFREVPVFINFVVSWLRDRLETRREIKKPIDGRDKNMKERSKKMEQVVKDKKAVAKVAKELKLTT